MNNVLFECKRKNIELNSKHEERLKIDRDLVFLIHNHKHTIFMVYSMNCL